MELSENTAEHLDAALCAYPFNLPEYFYKFIRETFPRKRRKSSEKNTFSGILRYINENDLLFSTDYKSVNDRQYDLDLCTHEHTDWKGLKKKYYLPAAFTFAYNMLFRFAEEYPEYILVAVIKVQVETVPAPEPLHSTTPFTRVSFYLYNSCSDGPSDLYRVKNYPSYDKKIMFWRFSTFDLPLLDWMIKKAKYEDRERKKEKARERARAKKASELAHAQRMAYVNNIEK